MLPSFYTHSQYAKAQNGRIATNVLILAMVLLLGLVYLWQINNLVRQGYTLRNFQGEIKLLQEENRKLQLDISQSQSLPKLQEAVKDFGLVLVSNVSHIEKPNPKVVASQVVKQP